jgi:hypothetical protein
LPQRGSDYAVLAFTGVLMFAVNYGLLFWGELHVSSGLAAVLQATIPIFGMLSAHLLLPDEPLRLQKLLGAMLALGGVAMICERLLGFSGLMAFWGGLGIVFGAAGAAFSSARDPTRASDDRRLANDFRRSAIAGDRIFGGRKSGAVSLERAVDLLFALSGRHRLRAYVFTSLLAVAANDCRETTSNLAHHATWRGRVRLGNWRRDVFPMVAFGRLFRPRRRMDDFPKVRSAGASNSGRLGPRL